MQTVSIVFSTLHCSGYIAGSLKSWDSQEKDYSFLGNDTLPNLYDALVYERKFKSEYLERQIYERSLKSEPSIVKLIEKLSEPSIVKFIENQSEHLSKLTIYHLKKRATRRSRRVLKAQM